jgi:hypothetical protein
VADPFAVSPDTAAIRIIEPREEVQQRRLARPGRADHPDDLTGGDLDRDIARRRDLVVT